MPETSDTVRPEWRGLQEYQLGRALAARGAGEELLIERLNAESAVADCISRCRSEFRDCYVSASDRLAAGLRQGGDAAQLTAAFEEELAPLAAVAREYTVHLCGHAHMDMNWTWNWPETVNLVCDTVESVLKVMEEFPAAYFSQSQAEVYRLIEEYRPELFRRVAAMIASGRWEVLASSWVEGERNLVSGEALLRQLLYTREYCRSRFGDAGVTAVDWAPDTFGHAETVPAIMSRGGMRYYYHMRPAGKTPPVYRWRSPDGSELLAFNERGREGYSGDAGLNMVRDWCRYLAQTGHGHWLYTYGYGDHGGGPTRRILRRIERYRSFPVMPQLVFDRVDGFFQSFESETRGSALPVVEGGVNFVFEGCYTAQSPLKLANRAAETSLPDAETLAVWGRGAGGEEFSAGCFSEAWRQVLFGHFHDILPGSGVRGSVDFMLGLNQQAMARVSSAENALLRGIGAELDTARLLEYCLAENWGESAGAGAGNTGRLAGEGAPVNYDQARFAAPSRQLAAADSGGAEPLLLYNPTPWIRSGTVEARIWNKQIDGDLLNIVDPQGRRTVAQVLERGSFWGHDYTALAFRTEELPAWGYRCYAVDIDALEPDPRDGVRLAGDAAIYGIECQPQSMEYVLDNGVLRLVYDLGRGTVTSIRDLAGEFEYLAAGGAAGLPEIHWEGPHRMSAWISAGAVRVETPRLERCEIRRRGPVVAAVAAHFRVGRSRIEVETALCRESRLVTFNLRVSWRETAYADEAVPVLKLKTETTFRAGKLHYEIPFGCRECDQAPQEIPALNFAALSGVSGEGWLAWLNRGTAAYRCRDGEMLLNLLRASNDPDPAPEVGEHRFATALFCGQGGFSLGEACRQGNDFNRELRVVNLPVHSGGAPLERSYGGIESGAINVSAFKEALDGDGWILHCHAIDGISGEGTVRFGDWMPARLMARPVDAFENPAGEAVALSGRCLAVKAASIQCWRIYPA